MANGSGKGCLANVLIALLVIVCGVGVFFFGANVEKATNGGVTGLVSGDAPAAQPSEPQDGAQGQEGQVLYDGDDMKVTFGSLENVDVSGMSILSLVVENKTGQDVNCIAEQGTLAVNDFDIDSVGGAEIQAGKSAVAQFMLSQKQANISGTDEIKSVSMNLEFVVLGSSVDVVAEAPISLTF